MSRQLREDHPASFVRSGAPIPLQGAEARCRQLLGSWFRLGRDPRHQGGGPSLAITSLVVAAALLAAMSAAPAASAAGRVEPSTDRSWASLMPPVLRLRPVSYQAFDGHSETLVPWQGQRVTVLVKPGVHRRLLVMRRLVTALDAAFTYYADTTGRVPAAAHSLNGRDEIAEVSSTCGAGCGFLGATGIEILSPYFESLYSQVAQSDLFDQVPFYELGRNFWFWSPQLQFHRPDRDVAVTGFAVWMRFRSMAAAGVQGAPFNGSPFETFRSRDEALIGDYEADPSLTFADTLAQDKSPGLYGGADFWASIMMHLTARHGDQGFVQRFWRLVGGLPTASSTTDAVTNWVQAANSAACTDLSPVFYDRWGFPRPDGTTAPRPPSGSVPEPVGQC